MVCFICYNLRKLQRIFASSVIYTKPANALECKLLSADSAIVIRGNPEPHKSDGVNIAAFVMRYALVGFQPQKVKIYSPYSNFPDYIPPKDKIATLNKKGLP